MRKLVQFVLCLLAMLTPALAQQTPNIGLQLPPAGTVQWNIPLNYNFNRLDSLLSGGAPLPGIAVAGNASILQLTTWSPSLTYVQGAVVFFQGVAYASAVNGNQGNQPPGTSWTTAFVGGALTPATNLLLKGNGTANGVIPAVPNTDYLTPGYFATLSNCTTSGYVFSPAATGCIAQSGGAVSSLTTTGTSGAATLISGVLNVPNYAGAVSSLTTTGSSGASTLISGVLNVPNYASPFQSLTTTGSSGAATLSGGVLNIPQYSGSSGSTKVIYASQIEGVTTGVTVVAGSSASGTTDSATAINAAIASGNVDLEVDSGFALSTALVLSSNTTIHCVAPQYGFIMQTSSNAAVLVNAHLNHPTTTSGTGGYLPSNITDQHIVVQGCQLNANSTQAVTGSSYAGVPHTVNPATSLFVLGVQFTGVNDVLFDHNELYDSGCWAVFFSNATNIRVNANYIHQPVPQVAQKSTDGVHFIGPDQFLWVTNNHINSGDDAVAFNADDGNRAGSGDPNLPQAQFPGVLGYTGWITDAVDDNTTLDAVASGGRLLSATELIDRVTISNRKGTANQDYLYDVSNQYPALGAGNIGSVTFDNFDVHNTTGYNPGPFCGEILITANYNSLQFRGIKSQNPPSGVQSLLCQVSGTGGTLSLRDWDVYTPTTTFPNVVSLTGGSIVQLAVSGMNWYDSAADSGHFFSGTVVPGSLTCSNYAGPNRLIASGFSPTVSNGDCFTNNYTSVTIPTAIHFWPMNEGSGSTFHDSIGSTNLTASNVTWAVTTGLGSSSVAQFNGTTSNAAAGSVDSSLNFNGSQPMTVAFWMNSPSAVSPTMVGNLEATGSYQGWEAGFGGGSGGQQDYLVVGAVTTNQMTAINASRITANTPYFMAVTYTGNLAVSGVREYINGSVQSISDATGTLTAGATSTAPLYVGSRTNNTGYYHGAMGYLRVWNQVLTGAQIAALYALGPQ